MQENEFEKNIKSRMDEFALVPDAEVWAKVSAGVAENKRRKRIVFIVWFSIGLLFLGGAGGYLLLNNNRATQQIPVVAKTKNAQNGENAGLIKSPKEKEDIAKTDTEEQTQQRKKEAVTEQHRLPVEETAIIPAMGSQSSVAKERKTTIGEIEKNDFPINQPIAANKKPMGERQKNSGFQPDFEPSGINNSHLKAQELHPHKYYKINERYKEPMDSTANAVVTTEVKLTNKTTELIKKRTWKLGLTAAAGISTNITGLPLIGNNYSSDYLNLSPSSSGAGSLPIRALKFTKGFSFSAGAFLQRAVKQRWLVSVGLNYQYYSAFTKVGSQQTNRTTLYDTLLGASNSVNQYYGSGQSVAVNNSYHMVGTPLLVGFRLNSNNQKPWQLIAGVTPAFLFNSNALYANGRERIYYKEKKQFNQFHLSVQAGLQVPIYSNKKYWLSAGPVFQYGINNLTKKVTQTNQHLFFTGIKTSVTLR